MNSPPAEPRARDAHACRFFLGTPEVSWLRRTDVPLFISRRRLERQKTWPRARGLWALDSGGFTELNLFGAWTLSAREYAERVRVYASEIGNMLWAATQDWMCEPTVLEKTGKTVAQHQERTVLSYLVLRDAAPDVPWSPALQGWEVDDYERCADRYAAAGVDLSALPVVGVGSVCRRQAAPIAASIFARLHRRGLRLHGFGLKLQGLALAAHHMVSSDSMAWSFGARKRRPDVQTCAHPGSCANCLDFALRWRERVISLPGVQ